MARGKRRAAPILEDITQKVNSTDYFIIDENSKLAYTACAMDGVAPVKTITEVSDRVDKLEVKVAELSLRDLKPGRRVKSIKIKF